MKKSDFDVIKKVLNVDNFEILNLGEDRRIRIDVKNQKFRSYAQAVGRILAHFNASKDGSLC